MTVATLAPASWLVAGPPKSGKSTFVSSFAANGQHGRIYVACAKPREANSAGYKHANVTTRIFYDRWSSAIPAKERKALGFVELLNEIERLYDDEEYDGFAIDPLTDVGILARNYLLQAVGAATIADLPDTRGFYGGYRDKVYEIVSRAVGLATEAAKRPKHVFVTVHIQPPKEGDEQGKDIEYEGKVLPMLDGQVKRRLMGDFDNVLFTDKTFTYDKKQNKKVCSYVVQLQPDQERPAAITIGTATQFSVANDFASVLGAIE